jgi:hypothetical protein
MPWTPIRTMARGTRPDFTLLNKPGNIYVTNAQRWFTDQLIDLAPRTVIAGWYSHKPGYHDTVEHNDARDKALGTDDYSTRDPEDRRGPRNKTRASDWTFRDAQAGDFTDFAKYGDRLLAAYRASDPRLAGWREYLGRISTPVTVNGVSTRRVGIDFRHRYLRIPDSTHDWHGHFSEDTEQVESFWNKWALLTIMADWTLAEWKQSTEEEFMATVDDKDWKALIWRVEGIASGRLAVAGGPTVGEPLTSNVRAVALEQKLGAVLTALATVDEATAAQLAARFTAIDAAQQTVLAAVAEVPALTVEALGAVDSPEEIADRLRAVLGDRAAAVGALLAQG